VGGTGPGVASGTDTVTTGISLSLSTGGVERRTRGLRRGRHDKGPTHVFAGSTQQTVLERETETGTTASDATTSGTTASDATTSDAPISDTTASATADTGTTGIGSSDNFLERLQNQRI